MQRTYRVRDLLHDLRRHGCRPVRTRGSHQTWTTPAGYRIGVVINYPGGDVSRTVLSSVRRALRAEGIVLGLHLDDGASSLRGGAA